jgi:hypothetical protein
MKKLVFMLTSIIVLLSLFYNCQTSDNVETEPTSTAAWTITSFDGAEVVTEEEVGLLHAQMLRVGNEIQNIEAKYNQEFILETGYKYKLTFDAWANIDKIIKAALIGNYSDDILDNDISYLEDHITHFLVTAQRQTFEFEFVAEEMSVNNAFISFYFGDTLGDLYLSNISLEQVGEEEKEKAVVSVIEFINNEDSNYLNVTCRSITDTILFNLNSIGKYETARIKDVSIDEIKQYASENNIDNVIFGRVYIDEDEIIQLKPLFMTEQKTV